MLLRLASLPAAALLLLAAQPALAQTLPATRLGTYATGLYNQSAAEIVVHDPATQRAFFVNAAANEVVALDASNPSAPVVAFTVSMAPYGSGANAVAVAGGRIAVAVEAAVRIDPGRVVFLSTADGSFLFDAPAGALPDGLAFTPDGQTVVVANEGEPSADYLTDPEGTISIIRLASGTPVVQTVSFADFNVGGPRHAEIASDPSIRIFGPNASVAQDLEPEFVAISPDGATAYVSLQENNALAVVDIATGAVQVRGLGMKNHALEGNGIDASDRDGGAIRITTWPVYGMYQPDGLAAYEIGGQTYVFAANEGDARDYPGYSEEARIGALTLNPRAFPDAAFLQDPARLGRLNSTRATGDVTGNGQHEALFAYGARSFSIHAADGARLWDSGDGIERHIAALIADGTLPPAAHNANHTSNTSADTRSDDKGPEPEGVVVGEVDGRIYAFVGLERASAVIVYDVTTPTAPTVAAYLSSRVWTGTPAQGTAGDLGVEGLAFVRAADSPTGRPLLITSNEVSGTVTFWQFGMPVPAAPGPPTGALDVIRRAGVVPNPGQAPHLALDLAAASDVEVTVFDALGREVARVARVSLGASAQRLDLPAGLPTGSYAARVRAGGQQATARFVIAR